jgi:LEA14-like dessication related protein
MKKNIIFYGLGIGIIYYLWTQYKNASQLVESAIVSPTDISFDWSHALAPAIFIKFNVVNPTNKVITISQIFINLYYNSDSIGTSTVNNPIILQPTSTENFEMKTTVSTIAVIQNIINTGSNTDIKLTAKGYFIASGVQFPINMDYTLKI